MRSLSLLAVTLAVLQLTSGFSLNIFTEPRYTEYNRPDFCDDYECPRYKVLEKLNGYELREYMPSVWVSAKIDRMSRDFYEHPKFTEGANLKLQYYFNGINDKNQTINMTVPVLKSHTKNEVHMRYMLPANYSQNPPTPNDPTVEIKAMPKTQYYVRTFGGWSTSENIEVGSSLLGYSHLPTQYNKLRKDLDRDGKSYTVTQFFTAEYDHPSVYFGRHNEIWIMKR